MTKRLKQWAQDAKEEFEAEFRHEGCRCWLAAPCSYCTHPGHPIALEDDDCWEEASEPTDDLWNSIVGAAGGAR